MKTLITLTCAIAAASALFAQTVPPLMNYQGRLTDEAGAALPDGQYVLAFRIFTNSVPVGGEPLIWGREYEASILGGVFSVALGAAGGSPVAEPSAVNDLTYAFSEPARFLELRIVRNAASNIVNRTILPRQQLLSSAYAFAAYQADRLIVEYQDSLSPPGTIVAYGGTTIPSGWLLCDGSPKLESQYPRLFQAIGTAWGAGYTNALKVADFNLPDLRGYFLRGVSGVSTNDPDRNQRTVPQPLANSGNSGNQVGSRQSDQFRSHRHEYYRDWVGGNPSAGNPSEVGSGGAWPRNNDTPLTQPAGGNETRPLNAYVHYIIKY